QANPEPLNGLLYDNLLRRGISGSLEDHFDPLDGQTYVASYAPVKNFGWGVVVQHERGVALQAVDDLRDWMRTFGLLALVGLFLLTTCLWGWLIWTLRAEERSTVAL